MENLSRRGNQVKEIKMKVILYNISRMISTFILLILIGDFYKAVGFLTIMNWATIWDTYEHFVYDYRNLARKRRIFRKITKIPVEIRGY